MALNFTDSEQVVPFQFTMDGDYAEVLDGNPAEGLSDVSTDRAVPLRIPSNYGRIRSRI